MPVWAPNAMGPWGTSVQIVMVNVHKRDCHATRVSYLVGLVAWNARAPLDKWQMKAPMHWPILVLVASAAAALGLNRHLSCVRSLVRGWIYYLQLCQLRLSIDGTALCRRHSIERSILLLQQFLSHQHTHLLKIHTNEIVTKCVHCNLAFDCTIWTLLSVFSTKFVIWR